MPAELLRAVSHEAYHRDAIEGHPGPHFSRGVALRILAQSPLAAYHAHPRLGGGLPDEPTDATDKGALVHQLLLGGGPEIVKVRIHSNKARIGPLVDAMDFRKDEAQEVRDQARAEGKLPVLPHILAEVIEAADAIRKRLLDLGVILGDPDDSEVTALWEDDGTPCKARLDHYLNGCISDLKVQRNLAVSQFEFTVKRFGLDIQSWAYSRAVEAAYPELAGRVGFEWLLVERKKPWDVAAIPASKTILSLGESRWRRALKTWKECRATGRWPGTGRLPALQARPYDLEQEMEAAVQAAGEPDWTKGD